MIQRERTEHRNGRTAATIRLGAIWLILALFLSACGADTTELPVSELPTEVPSTASSAELPTAEPPTPEPVVVADAEPTADDTAIADESTAEPVSDLTFRVRFENSDEHRLDGLSLDLAGLADAPAGKTYAVWLVDDSGQYQLLGAAEAGQTFHYSDPDGQNLVGRYSGALLSLEAPANVQALVLAAPTDTVYSGAIPAEIVANVRQLAVTVPDTPDAIGYAPGLVGQTALAVTHAQLALNAIATGDHRVGKLHVEHVSNILNGSDSPDFGDLDGDGEAQNPGDGYGVLPYAWQVSAVAGQIAQVTTLPDALADAAAGIVICADNVAGLWGAEALAQARGVLDAADAAASEGPGLELATVTAALDGGVDANSNGEIEIFPGECGAEQIYQLSHELFDITLTAQQGPERDGGPVTEPAAQPTDEPVTAAEVTVNMDDFVFVDEEITVPVGTTVTWLNTGAIDHSATAVDGSFDTGVYGSGGSESFTFETAGTFAYYCILHGTPDGQSGMVGKVIVE